MAGPAPSPNGDDGPPEDVQDESQSIDQPPAAKKRRTGTSSRGVANLTPEQLARKRANDREAQRAIRERTKNQIDRLNQRIRELESQQPYHDLQVVLREKEAVQAENADIRKRLESVLSLIQPIVRPSGGLNELAAAAERSLPPPHQQLPHQQPQHQTAPRETPSHPTDPRSFNATLSDIAAAASPQNGTHSPSGTDAGRPWLFPGDGPTSHMRRYSTESPQFEHMRPPQMQSDMSFDERLGVDFLLADNGQRRPVDPNLPPPQQPASNTVVTGGTGSQAPNLVPHLTMPRNITATCPLDVILLDFLADRQARAAEGVPTSTLVGPKYPNFTSLVHPERNVDAHPLSKLFTDILRTFPDICGLPEQVAIVFIMFLVMRWQIDPTQENYDRLPDWITPRASQLFVPHPAWFEHVPWPKLRDRLIAEQPFSAFDTFFIPFTTTISLNWPYDARDCLLPASKLQVSALSATSSIPASSPYSTHVNAGSPPGPPTPQAAANSPGTFASKLAKEDDQWLINPAFESHLRNLNNWSLGSAFRTTFPSYADVITIKETR